MCNPHHFYHFAGAQKWSVHVPFDHEGPVLEGCLFGRKILALRCGGILQIIDVPGNDHQVSPRLGRCGGKSLPQSPARTGDDGYSVLER